MRDILGEGGEEMDKTSIKAKSLSQLYVFYNRLNEDPNPMHVQLYNNVKAALSTQHAELKELEGQSQHIRDMAQAEADKELRLLNNIFQANVSLDFTDKNSIKNFIDTLNTFLSLKEVYDRNINIIKNSQGQKSVISFFPTYFMHAWNRWWPIIYDQALKAATTNKSLPLITAVEQALDANMNTLMTEAITEMFNAEPELNTVPPELKGAYQELLNHIGNVRNQGDLANQLYNIYNLENIKNLISEELSSSNKRWQKQKLKGFDPTKSVEKQFAQRGGLSLEAIENTVQSMIVEKLQAAGTITVGGAVHSGDTKIKADNILTVGINSQIVQQSLQSIQQTSREENIAAIESLGQSIKNIKDGYIIYSSDKNYTYNDGFEKRGGFGGENISARTYLTIMGNINKNINTFVGTMLQTAPGAVGDQGIRPDIEKAIACDVAYMLFDDFSTIGTDVNDATAIHIMNLNGVLIPLSFFLHIYAEALDFYIYNPAQIVKVNVRAPAILFPTQESQNEYGAGAWEHQRSEALAKTMIEMHFLGSFKDLVEQYL